MFTIIMNDGVDVIYDETYQTGFRRSWGRGGDVLRVSLRAVLK